MAIARRLGDYLQRHGARYDVVTHPRSQSSIDTADKAHVPGERLVKSVVLEDDDGMMLAVLPSTLSVHLGHLSSTLQRRLRLADEDELQSLFPDCRAGAVPPIGPAYGLRAVLDDTIEAQEDVYFEAGDHESLVHMTTREFLKLLEPAQRVHLSQAGRHATGGRPQ